MIKINKDGGMFCINQDNKDICIDLKEIKSLIIYFSNNIEIKCTVKDGIESLHYLGFDKCKNTRIKKIDFYNNKNFIEFNDGVFIHSIQTDGVIKYYDCFLNECLERI